MVALSDGFIVMDPDFIGSPEHPTGAHDILADARGEMVMPIGCFLIRGERNVLVDLGYGPHDENGAGTMVGGNLLHELRVAGLRPEDIDVVALSHLHPDHVGWLGDSDGRPLFPSAQVYIGSGDWDHFVVSATAALPLAPHIRATLVDLFARGSITLMESDLAITPHVTRLSAPGHTPGHSIYAVHSGDDRAMLFGDAVYCAEQMTELDWAAATDVDRVLARETREKYVRQLEREGGLGLGCHFPALTAQRLLISRGD
jgi:glyoxylase-like metal-dependent hydrolase (beta-lactamase superfamily II)